MTISEMQTGSAGEGEKPEILEYVDIVFDGEPSHLPGSFVEVEHPDGSSIQFGDWIQRRDGFWVLRISAASFSQDVTNVAPEYEGAETIQDGGWTTLTEGTDDTLRLTVYANEETFIWTEIDDSEVDSLITQLIDWRQNRRLGRKQDA